MVKEEYNVMVVGGGGREHTLAWKLAQSSMVKRVFVAPGNAGTSLEEKCVNISIDGAKASNFENLYGFVRENRVNMVVVGPEQPLADGIVDFFREKGCNRVFGPTKEAARLESSKIFSYELMLKLGIPQAESIICTDESEAKIAIGKIFAEYGGAALKADGLTGGKGVFVTSDRKKAESELPMHLKRYCPDGKILVAQRLVGEEFSVFGFADGKRVVPILMSVQDHKLLYDEGDNEERPNPNTGGMGAYCPAPIAPASLVQRVCDEMMTPVAEALGFVGFLYLGGMMTKDGVKVIEYNIRFGDPECQPGMMMIKSDLFELISRGLEGKLNADAIEFNPGAACCVVLAAKGYPEDVSAEKGKIICGIEAANELGGAKVFHAGTKLNDAGNTVISGGRVLGVTGYSPDGLLEAQARTYRAASLISTESGFHFRKDIGAKAFK